MYLEDDVIRLREWNTDIIHRLPRPPWFSASIGSSDACSIQLADRRIAAEHAHLERDDHGWLIKRAADAVFVDGVVRDVARIDPGVEIGIGGLTLVAEGRKAIELRSFMARLLGWTSNELDEAMWSIRLAATRRVPLVLCGPGDMIAVAQSIHRRAFGAAPFVVCDYRRREGEDYESVRSAINYVTGIAAMQRAIGGSLCMWSRRLPDDFADVRLALRDPATRMHLIVCAESRRHVKPYHVEPIVIPPLSTRTHEIARIIDEYADDAAAETLAAVHLTAADRDWILRNSASSISEIDKGTRRLLAIRNHDNNTAAAARALGMAPISLARWLGRRSLPGHRTSAVGVVDPNM